MSTYLKIGQTLFELRRLPCPEGAISFGLIAPRPRDSQVVSFDAGLGSAACTCDGCTCFGECRHARAIRRAVRSLGSLPLRKAERFFGFDSPSDWAAACQELEQEDAEPELEETAAQPSWHNRIRLRPRTR